MNLMYLTMFVGLRINCNGSGQADETLHQVVQRKEFHSGYIQNISQSLLAKDSLLELLTLW